MMTWSVGPSALSLAGTWRSRLRGLLGAGPREDVLLLAPCNSIHTFGMRYAIDVAFIDQRGGVVRTLQALPPGRVARCRRAVAVLERAAQAGRWYRPGDVVQIGCVQPAFTRERRP